MTADQLEALSAFAAAAANTQQRLYADLQAAQVFKPTDTQVKEAADALVGCGAIAPAYRDQLTGVLANPADTLDLLVSLARDGVGRKQAADADAGLAAAGAAVGASAPAADRSADEELYDGLARLAQKVAI